MKHTFEQRIFYADTDSYGVVWHGSYLRLMEMGRVYWTEAVGFNLIDLKENHDVVIPVAGVNIKYKMSAKVDDVVIVETELASYNGLTAVFRQIIRNKESGRIYTDAKVTIVAVSNSGKLYRKMPEMLDKVFKKELECLQPV
ncbi:acyl-CoA thioesterase [bacterium]|nr:acyl-CoA thioesterase [bacterium]